MTESSGREVYARMANDSYARCRIRVWEARLAQRHGAWFAWVARRMAPSESTGEESLTPIVVSLVAFVIIMGGAFTGSALRKALPDDHLADDAKDIVRLGTGLVGTIAALVLGLLIASAKSSYDTQLGQVQRLTADIVLLDQLLAQYGPEARPIRDLMRQATGPLVERLWRERRSNAAKNEPFTATGVADAAFARIGQLAPQNDAQRSFKARAIEASTDLAQTRLALFVQASNSIPMPFLAVLIFWLAIIFASFSLFSPLNSTLVAALVVFALSAAAALFLILEMGEPFTGLMEIPSAPLRNALAPLAS
jgi:hypothetical protein